MKKITFVLLSCLIGSGTVWGDCPSRDSIIIENDHYVAYDQFGTRWVDINPTYGHKLPATTFWRAMGLKRGDVGAFVTRVDCAYTTNDGHAFGLEAPLDQIYQLGESPYWEIADLDGPYKMYVCSYRATKESNCPFKPYG